MLRQVSRVGRRLADAGRAAGLRETTGVVVGAGLLLIATQLAFRAWALYGGWFYLDDYNLLSDADGQRLDGEYLLQPYNDHLMPGARLLAWVVASSGHLNWTLAATVVLLWQALASGAALWMLLTLFGGRWGILGPLSLYLASAVTIPALLWWAAAVNQVPLQAAFFAAVATWVRYLRGGRLGWLLATCLAVAVGLAFFEKAVLILPVLAFLGLAYYASGGPVRRLLGFVRQYWPAVLAGALLGGAYTAYYLTAVSQPFEPASASLGVDLADAMIGTAFMAGAVGGPWQWSEVPSPAAYADPPAWAQHVSWVLAALVVLYGALRRHGTWRAWLLLSGYLLALLGLLLNSRAPVFGPTIGLEYRYLTDVVCVLALCVGLALLPMRDVERGSRARITPLLTLRPPRGVVAGLVCAVAVSATISSATYAADWHRNNASDAYLRNLTNDIASQGSVDLADTVVPDEVISSLAAPDNTVSRLAGLVSDDVAFPQTTARLVVVAPDGGLRQALISPGVVSRPGPREDCGWHVRERGRTIDLEDRAFDWTWWVRVGYLASADSPVTVSAGDITLTTTVGRGPNSLYLRIDGTFDTVRIDGLDPGTTMCVDTVEVGQAVPGGPLT